MPIRTATAITVLAGGFALPLLLSGVAAATVAWAVDAPGPYSIAAAALFTAVALAQLNALIRAIRHPPPPLPGVRTDRTSEPALWALLDEAASAAGARPPERLHLVATTQATLARQRGHAGTMLIGVPLVDVLSVGELRAVIVHALAGSQGASGRWNTLVHSAVETLENARGVLVDGTTPLHRLALWLFSAYARLYLRVARNLVRTEEAEADRVMTAVAGPETARTASRAMRASAAAWSELIDGLVARARFHGLTPSDLLGGFRQLMIESRTPVPGYDPASRLLADPARWRGWVAESVLGTGTAMEWDELATTTASLDAAQEGLRLLVAVERVLDVPSATLGTVWEAIGEGEGPALAADLEPSPAPGAAEAALGRHVRSLVAAALCAEAGARWRFAWAEEAALLVGAGGDRVDLTAIASGLGAEHAGVLRAWCTARGLSPGFRPEPPERAAVFLLGMIPCVSLENELFDIVVFDVGLLFARMSVAEGMRGTLSRAPMHARIERVASTPPDELLDRADSFFVPEDVILRASFWHKEDRWVATLVLSSDDEGDSGEFDFSVKGNLHGFSPGEVRATLAELLTSRLSEPTPSKG